MAEIMTYEEAKAAVENGVFSWSTLASVALDDVRRLTTERDAAMEYIRLTMECEETFAPLEIIESLLLARQNLIALQHLLDDGKEG